MVECGAGQLFRYLYVASQLINEVGINLRAVAVVQLSEGVIVAALAASDEVSLEIVRRAMNPMARALRRGRECCCRANKVLEPNRPSSALHQCIAVNFVTVGR